MLTGCRPYFNLLSKHMTFLICTLCPWSCLIFRSFSFSFQLYILSLSRVILDLDFLVSQTKRLPPSFDKLWYIISFNLSIMYNKTKKIKFPSGLLKQKWGQIVFSNNRSTITFPFYAVSLIRFHKEFAYKFLSLDSPFLVSVASVD